LVPAHFSKKDDPALSTFPVDKFVDFLWAARRFPRNGIRKSGATKISSLLSGNETAPYEIESVSTWDWRAPACIPQTLVH
jgi:hypothetical protein